MHSKALVIGSRGSQLALWQARHVAAELEHLGVASRIEIIKTTGDHLQTVSLVQAGGKGLFTKEIEDALLAGHIDLAVHSLKDLPTETPDGLSIAAIPEREDPRDAILGKPVAELAPGSRVGTSSGRRAAQLLALRPGIDVQPVRGNVDTRIRKLKEGQYEAILLAVAGLRRLGLQDEIAEILTPDRMCPAPGQGALAIETRAADAAEQICQALNHEPTSAAVRCERAVLAALGGGCQLPIGAFASADCDSLHVMAVVISPDGQQLLRVSSTASSARSEQLGHAVANDLIAQGALSILAVA